MLRRGFSSSLQTARFRPSGLKATGSKNLWRTMMFDSRRGPDESAIRRPANRSNSLSLSRPRFSEIVERVEQDDRRALGMETGDHQSQACSDAVHGECPVAESDHRHRLVARPGDSSRRPIDPGSLQLVERRQVIRPRVIQHIGQGL